MLHSDHKHFGIKLYRGSDLTEHATPTSAFTNHRQKSMVLFVLGS